MNGPEGSRAEGGAGERSSQVQVSLKLIIFVIQIKYKYFTISGEHTISYI
jgi:hypothetical protein